MAKRKTLFYILILLCINISYAQNIQDFGYEHLAINKTGMYVLGGWSTANLVSGIVGWQKGSGKNKYFHQMNAMWNTVNAAIVVGSLISISNKNYALMSQTEILADQFQSQKLFIINAGLDLGYMAGGLYMKHLAEKKPERRDRFHGYGNSILVQGGFLFLFDGVFYLLQRNHRLSFLENFAVNYSNDMFMTSLIFNF